MYTLGIDVGSSSVKVSVLDLASGSCAASSTNPKVEMPIKAVHTAWAEQDPDMWWKYVLEGIADVGKTIDLKAVKAVGITYQMHGLVCVDREGKPLRYSIIWCDSRAVELGAQAMEELGREKCLEHLLNSPGNFTASKLAWVIKNEPELYAKIYRFMLPGDYIAYKLSGEMGTSETGLSEGILWDFKDNCRADFVAEHYDIDKDKFCDIVPSIGIAARISAEASALTGLSEGTPVSYRAGDQPNNAFSLNVLNPGEVAATGGTSGVVYGVTDLPKADSASRVNTFLHVNNTAQQQRLGVLLCINGTGILNSWLHRNVCPELSYPQMNQEAAKAPAGCDGLLMYPFGNGAERVLENKAPGAGMLGLSLVRHTRSHMLRAAQEGIAFAFRYGIDVMKELGLNLSVIRAGKANLFLSDIFRQSLATLCDATIELYDTDGSLGAARGAALGAGLYASSQETFKSLNCLERVTPNPQWKEDLDKAYENWIKNL